jgi:hypothetical protein
MVLPSIRSCHVRLGAVLGALVLAACSQPLPSSPEAATVPAASSDTRALASASAEGNEPPRPVFKTRPAADANNRIYGGGVFDVTFNMCPSTETDPGDELKFTYDYDGDGTVDWFGHCRSTHTYYAADFAQECQPAVVCVGDRHPDNQVCMRYEVCAGAKPETKPLGPSTNQTVSGAQGLGQMDVYSFTASAGTILQVVGDTVSAATTYDVAAIVGNGPTIGGSSILFGVGDDNTACTFPPPAFSCPSFTTATPFPADGTYYLIVLPASAAFAGSIGEYTISVNASLPIGPLTLVSNDVTVSGQDPVAALSAHGGASASSTLRALQAKRSGRPQRER